MMKRRTFLKNITVLGAGVLASVSSSAQGATVPTRYDAVIFGATPSGITAAIRMAREGYKVLLVSVFEHIGGMLTNGLSMMDTLYEGQRAPLYNELLIKVQTYYADRYGSDSENARLTRFSNQPELNSHPKFESKVMLKLLTGWVADEKNITLLRQYEVASFVAKGLDGKILVYERDGVFRCENDAFTLARKFTDNEYYLTYPYFAPSGAVWNLTREKLIENKSGETTEFELPPDLKNFLANTDFITFFNSYTVKILETGIGEIWFTVGFYIYKLENGEIVRISKEEQSSFDAKIVSDKNGDIWFGIWRKGVCRFANNDYECLDANKVLAGDSVRDIFTDREGTLWIASNANGLFRLTEQFIAPLFTDETAVGKNVYPILEDKSGAVWIGTSGGLSVYKDGKFTDYRKNKKVLIESLFEDRDGRLWVGTVNFGLFLFQNGNSTILRKNLISVWKKPTAIPAFLIFIRTKTAFCGLHRTPVYTATTAQN